MKLSTALTFLLLASISCAAFGFQCPENQHLYKNCSVCFFPSPPDHILTFEEASSFCSAGGGALLSFITQGDLNRVERYLEGLQQERREFWVGYRHNASDDRVAENGGPASNVVLNTTNFITGRTQPGPARCIGVKGGKFFTRSCTRQLRFICEYFYTVPAPEVSPENETVYARFGSNTTLSATIPFPGVSRTEWKQNGSVITSNRNGIEIRNVSMESGQILYTTLTITNFNSSTRHSGAYVLTVQNAAGVAMVMEWQVREAVLGPLTFEPSDLSVVREQIAAFECHTPNSAPPPMVTWYKDSSQSPLESSGRVYVSQETGTLYIREVVVGDAGMYRCVLENLAGTRTSRRARLTVATSFPAGVASPGQVGFYFPPRNQSVALGDSFVVDCVGRFTASPLLMAVLSHKTFAVPDQIFMYPNDTGFPQFRIDNVGLDNDGICYVCGVFHRHYLLDISAGNLVVGTSVVTVYAAAFISNFYTEQNGKNSSAISQSIPPGSDITIHCKFDGRPRPGSSAVEWYRDGVRINFGVSTSDSDSTLTVRDFRSSGVYQCHVTNTHGSDMASVFLCLQQQDALPNVVSFLAVPDTNSSIYVEWAGDNSSTDPLLLRYLVSIFGPLANGSMEMNFNLLSEARSLVIDELQPNEAYQVAVKTSSLKGTAEVAGPQRVFTFPNAPTETFPDSVVLALRTEDNTLLVVSWDTFTPSSGPPLPPAASYQVQVEYQMLGGAGGRSRSVTVNGTERQALISVSDASNYQVRLRVVVQSQRDPPANSYSPWTSYIRVSGVTTNPPTLTPPATDEIMMEPVSAMLLIFILIPVGVILLVLLTVILVLGIYCWYRRRPDGVYSISDSGKRRKKTDSFKAVTTTMPHLSQPSPAPVPYATVSRDNTDFGSVPNTTTDHMRYGVTISVVDTNSMERDQTHATESWLEEFDHLETLVTTLNDTVTSMAGNGAPHGTDGSDTSLVINNANTGLHHGRVVGSHEDEGDATLHKMNLDSGRATAHSGDFNSASSSSVEASPRPFVTRGVAGSHSDTEEGSETSIVKQNLAAAPDTKTSNSSAEINTSTPLETRNQSLENFPFHSGSHSSMSTIEILVDTQDMREEDDEEEGAEFGSIHDVYNSTALEEAVKLGTRPSEGFHSNTTLEVGSTEEIVGMGSMSRNIQVKREVKSDNDDIEFDENLMELLKYGNKQDLTLV